MEWSQQYTSNLNNRTFLRNQSGKIYPYITFHSHRLFQLAPSVWFGLVFFVFLEKNNPTPSGKLDTDIAGLLPGLSQAGNTISAILPIFPGSGAVLPSDLFGVVRIAQKMKWIGHDFDKRRARDEQKRDALSAQSEKLDRYHNSTHQR